MKYYKAKIGWKPSIEIVEVVKETDKFVLIKDRGGKEAKTTDGTAFRKTFEEAKNFLLEYANNKVKNANDILAARQSYLDQVKAVQEPN